MKDKSVFVVRTKKPTKPITQIAPHVTRPFFTGHNSVARGVASTKPGEMSKVEIQGVLPLADRIAAEVRRREAEDDSAGIVCPCCKKAMNVEKIGTLEVHQVICPSCGVAGPRSSNALRAVKEFFNLILK